MPCRAKLPNDPIKITLPDGTVKDGVKVSRCIAALSAQLDGGRGMWHCIASGVMLTRPGMIQHKTTPFEIAMGISKGLANNSVVALGNGQVC